jgi:hypothetical protein
MNAPTVELEVLPETFAVCRLPSQTPIPRSWLEAPFFSLTRTPDELSLVCAQSQAPEGKCERDWRCLKVKGPLDFQLNGILASLAQPLAASGISLFALSAYDTDYLMVKAKDLEPAITALEMAGHSVVIWTLPHVPEP